MAKKVSKSVFFGGAAIVTVLVYLGVFFVSGISSDYSTDKYLAEKNDKLTDSSVVLDLDVKSVDLLWGLPIAVFALPMIATEPETQEKGEGT